MSLANREFRTAVETHRFNSMLLRYHQIKVDEESSNLLVISTPMGRYKFTVLTQGVCSSSDIFNYLTDGSLIHDNSGVLKNMNDVLIPGRNLKGLKDKLENFLEFVEKTSTRYY